jgi:hypothetical protein
MKRKLDEIINRCIANVLSEAEADSAFNNAKNRVQNRLKELVRNDDERTLEIMKTMGYNSGISPKEMRGYRTQAYGPGLTIGSTVNQDAIRVIKILRQYVNKGGQIDFDGLRRDYENEYGEIMRIKHFLDRNGLTYYYDITANEPTHPYGVNFKNGGSIDDLDFNAFSDSEVEDYIKSGKDESITYDEALFNKRKSLIDQYLEYKYGLSIDIPNINYSYGNKKLPSDTLIVNFTSAFNCPAWNECLLKHACYARGTEKGKDSVYRANENKSVYWQVTEGDPELLKLMLEFIRTFIFDYSAVVATLVKRKLIARPKAGDDMATKISRYDLNSDFFTPEIIEVMKEHKRANKIRLNENGDFIGQWLVDAWEQEAAKYQPYDVWVSAYTCRNLNYEGIKNLILNVSKTTISSKGNNSQGVARHFIAVPEAVYNALDETYGGNDNQLALIKNSVQSNVQPLYNIVTLEDGSQVDQPNGKYYYKCPCDRVLGSNKINCYQCNFCYLPKANEDEMYVFVNAHGSAKANLKGYDLLKCNIGVSQHFFNNYNIKKAKKAKKTKLQEDIKQPLGIMLQNAEKMGVQGITNNVIKSVYGHFKQLGANIKK